MTPCPHHALRALLRDQVHGAALRALDYKHDRSTLQAALRQAATAAGLEGRDVGFAVAYGLSLSGYGS